MWSDLSPAERRAFLNTREDLSDLLEDLAEFLDGQADADHNGQSYVPNEAMKLHMRVQQVIEDIALSRKSTIGASAEHWEDHARLIASAPDLLEALQWASSQMGLSQEPRLIRGQNDAYVAGWHLMHAALEKATGR
jgi:hypothetical protein